MADLAKDLFDEIGVAIEKMPQDGIAADGVFSPELRSQQGKFVDGMRYARWKAFIFIRDKTERKDNA